MMDNIILTMVQVVVFLALAGLAIFGLLDRHGYFDVDALVEREVARDMQRTSSKTDSTSSLGEAESPFWAPRAGELLSSTYGNSGASILPVG